MKNLRAYFLFSALFFLAIAQSNAQSKVIENITKVYLKNMGAITEENEVTGYYMFYQTDKIDRKNYSYEVTILDQNLNQIATKSITGSRYLYLRDGIYNEDALLLQFYDGKEKVFINRFYDKKAKEIKVIKKPSTKIQQRVLGAEMMAGSSAPTTFAMNNVGFVEYGAVKPKSKYGYEIKFFPTKEGMKSWSVKSKEDIKLHEFGTYIYGDEDILINALTIKKTAQSKSFSFELLGINPKNGSTLFRKPIEDPKYNLMVYNGFKSADNKSVHLFGEYYQKAHKQANHASLGLFSMEMDFSGKIISKKYVSWAEDVSKFLPIDAKGRIKDVGFTYFHNIVSDAEGNVYAIGEQYRKQASATGIALRVLEAYSGNTNSDISTAEMMVEDLMVFEFTPEFKLKNVKVVEKTKNRILLPEGAGWYGPQMLAHYIRARGGFDYEFLQFNKDRSIFSIGYLDFEKRKKEKNRSVFGTVTYTDGKAAADKIELTKLKGNDRIRILPGKAGNILLIEYLSKEKKLDFQLEKINF